MNRKSKAVDDRDEFERLLREARLRRDAYLGKAIAGMARAMRMRAAAWLGARGNTRAPAAA